PCVLPSVCERLPKRGDRGLRILARGKTVEVVAVEIGECSSVQAEKRAIHACRRIELDGLGHAQHGLARTGGDGGAHVFGGSPYFVHQVERIAPSIWK